ncbi:MAG TPA: hypothetical protein VNW53_15105 [Phenylobacterium sp.]|nr:hypothetical protein [Phenylobacterium sp.]
MSFASTLSALLRPLRRRGADARAARRLGLGLPPAWRTAQRSVKGRLPPTRHPRRVRIDTSN